MLLFEIWSLGYKPFPFFIDSREVSCITLSSVLCMWCVTCGIVSWSLQHVEVRRP